MQALGAVLNTADNVKSTKGSRSSQADSITMIAPGDKTSFTGILAQLFTMFPTAASAKTDGQSGNKQVEFTNVPGQKTEIESEESNIQGNEATLPGIMLVMPAICFNKPDKSPEKGTILEAVLTKSEVKSTTNKYFAAATGDIPWAMAEMQAVTGNNPETIISGSNIQPGIGQTNQTSKILAIAQPQDAKSAVLGSYSTDQSGFVEAIGQTGKERQTITAEIRPGNEPTAATSFSVDQVFKVPTSQNGIDSRIMAAAEMPVTENMKETVNSEAARSEFKKAVGQTGQESKIIVNTEQPAIDSPHEVTTSGKGKPVIDETARPTGKDNKNPALIGQQDSGSAESTVTDITAKSITKKSVKASGDEVGFNHAAGKKADISVRDTAGEPNLQPSPNNIQVTTERPGPERKVMSKSQIDHIAANLAGQINSGTSSLEINLQPESLGKIKLMFQMDDGSLSVRIIAHSEETRNLLDASLQSIKDSLNQQGIKVNDMSLDLANQEKHGNQNGSSYREASRTFAMMSEKKESHNHTDNWEQNSTQNRRLNILA